MKEALRAPVPRSRAAARRRSKSGPRAIGVLRLCSRGGSLVFGAAASLELPVGALRPSMTEPNLVDAAAFRQTLRSVLERAGVLGGARVALVLPDPVARIAILSGRRSQGPTAQPKPRS